ncbi:CII family transcriptional regulator [Pantoea sp. MBD-2R]|uniref:CII family transcriptional regulator n=1 Tax=Pantoea sp. MBD-2R TaxID=3141540 RepID=UPI003183DE8D
MEITSTRKKAMRIETQLLGKLAVFGQAKFAKFMGCHESQVSRMKEDFISKASMMLAILEYGVDDTEIVELARRFAAVLTNKKAPAATEADSQITINF